MGGKPGVQGSNRRTLKWAAILIRFASAQGVVQVLGFVSGIAIVSALEKESYAQYTVVIALIAAMTALSEAGLSSVMLSVGGRHQNDANRLSSLFTGGLAFRRRVGLVVAIFGNVVLVVALQQIGADLILSVVYVAIASATFVPILAKGVFQVYLRLKLDVSTLQRLALISSFLRFVIIMPMALTNVASVQLLLGVGFLVVFLEAWVLRRKSRRDIDLRAPILEEDVLLFRKSLKQTLPMNFPFVLQGQVLYLLLAWLGSAIILADIAALSRFGLVFAVLNAVITDIAAGYLARFDGGRAKLIKLYGLILSTYVFCAVILVVAVAVFAQPMIGLLGPQYSGLDVPLIVVAAGSALINIGNALMTLNHARGWLKWSWVFFPMTISWCLFGVFVLDLGNVFEAAIFMAAQAAPLLVTQIVCLVSGALRYGSTKNLQVVAVT